jgi:hypothetical protein
MRMRPAGTVVSIASVSERKPAPAASTHSRRRRTRGVDALEDHEEVVEEVVEGAREAVERPDHRDVAGSELVEQAVQRGPIPATARRRLAEHALDARLGRRAALEGAGLVVAPGEARVAEQHGRPHGPRGCSANDPGTRAVKPPQNSGLFTPGCIAMLGPRRYRRRDLT